MQVKLDKMLQICPLSRGRRTSVTWLLAVALCIACIFAYKFNDELVAYASYRMRTFPDVQRLHRQTGSGGVRCFNVEFSQDQDRSGTDQLGSACPYQSANQPLCRITAVGHLNQSEFVSAHLRIPGVGSRTIAAVVHPPWDMISHSVLKWGAWEKPLMLFMRDALTAAPGAGLLDVGSQLGVYSLLAAQMGRQAVAIDAFYQNSIRLFASATANGFQDRLRVYWNALSVRSNGKMNMNLPGDCNIGGGGPTAKGERGTADPIDVRTATLDDIVVGDGCFSGVKELLMKADIEGNEWLITDTGAKVFKRFKVVLIMMEWVFIKTNPKAAGMIEFYRSHGLLPHSLSGSRLQPLDGADFKAWPWDVFFATKELAAQVSAKRGWW